MEMELTVRIRYEDGFYWADVPELPGLFASGQTLDELKEAVVEAAFMYHEDEGVHTFGIEQVNDEEQPPAEGRVDEMKLAVPA